jgi:hypothetical protein
MKGKILQYAEVLNPFLTNPEPRKITMITMSIRHAQIEPQTWQEFYI